MLKSLKQSRRECPGVTMFCGVSHRTRLFTETSKWIRDPAITQSTSDVKGKVRDVSPVNDIRLLAAGFPLRRSRILHRNGWTKSRRVARVPEPYPETTRQQSPHCLLAYAVVPRTIHYPIHQFLHYPSICSPSVRVPPRLSHRPPTQSPSPLDLTVTPTSGPPSTRK